MMLQGKWIDTQQIVKLYIDGEIISKVEWSDKKSDLGVSAPDVYISPSFFDPQVNGFAGVDFNGKDLTPKDVHLAAQLISATGVTSFFPTLITAPFERLLHQLKILKEAIEHDPLVFKMCKGIHLEGPYISSSEGPRGVHPLQFIRPPQWEEFEKFQEVCGGRIKLITLAPEIEGCLDFIKKAVSSGVVVAIGHTNASGEILEAAYKAGARLSTHLGNGVGDQILRPRNPFQKQLSMDGLMASIIADGIHLPENVVKDIVMTKTPKKVLLCTDAISGASQPPGRYRLADLEVETGEDGRTRLIETGSLAGSILTMPKAITNVIKFTGVDLGTAIKMAAGNGRKLFPEMIGTIALGQPANLVVFRFDGEVKVEKTYVMGEEIQPIASSTSQMTNFK